MIPVQESMPPPAASSFSPMKILVPSAIVLAVAFAVIFLLTRNSPVTTDANINQQPTQTLAADPNSQPVQVASPPTGKAEEGLPSGGTITPPANVNLNANAAVSPEVIEDPSPEANENENSNSNNNANSNRKAPALPEPTRSVVPETAPPLPSPTKPPEKPSPTPTP
jgi:hypothetical protein